jgi:hypothetical protein
MPRTGAVSINAGEYSDFYGQHCVMSPHAITPSARGKTRQNKCILDVKDCSGKSGAGSGNQTRVFSLEGFHIVQ